MVTLLATVYSFSQFLFAPIWGRLSDRWGRRPIILLTLGGLVVGYAALTLANSLLLLFLARAFTGAMAANMGVVSAYITDITTIDDRARGMGPRRGGTWARVHCRARDRRAVRRIRSGQSRPAIALYHRRHPVGDGVRPRAV